MFPKKRQRTHNNDVFDDDEWIRSLTEAEAITAELPEVQVTLAAQDTTSGDTDVDPKKVRPIQMGECVRKYVSTRLLALSEGEIAALVTAVRHVGVGSQRGAEALSHLPSAYHLTENNYSFDALQAYCFGINIKL